jgi:hypothetical protein
MSEIREMLFRHYGTEHIMKQIAECNNHCGGCIHIDDIDNNTCKSKRCNYILCDNCLPWYKGYCLNCYLLLPSGHKDLIKD